MEEYPLPWGYTCAMVAWIFFGGTLKVLEGNNTRDVKEVFTKTTKGVLHTSLPT